jgi:hypothetical protein
LPTFEDALVAAEESANLRLDGGWQIWVDINGGDVMGNGWCGLAFVRLPPRSESLLSNVTHQGLPLDQSVLVDADSEDV